MTMVEGEGRFRKVFEHAPFSILVSGLDGRIMLANAAFCRLLGYSKEELRGRTWSELTHPDDRAPCERIKEHLGQDPDDCVEADKRYIHRNGSVVWVRIRISVIRDAGGAPECFVVHVEDVAERRRAEAALVLLAPVRLAADPARWHRLGFAGHVSKPVKQGDLGRCLASIVGYGPPPVRPGDARKSGSGRRGTPAQARLLVVEDNEVNQMVALGVLESLGYRATDVVADGPSALRALAEEDYDLVLMDCQLPGMDGYEATRQIRQPGSAVRNHDVPIIATTAHAMAGDREKCLAAGMNGYVSKPLRHEDLARAIEEWSGHHPARKAPAPAAAAAPSSAPTIHAAFDREDFIDRLMGNEDLARRIIRGFMDDMPNQIASLAQAVNNFDSAAVRMVAHSIKGAAANVGGLEMREIAWKLEQKGSTGDLAAAAAEVPALAASFERVKPALEKFCRQDPGIR